MDYRILDLIIVSAKGLKKASFMGRMDVYAVVSISGVIGKGQKIRTCIHKNGDSDPTWNFPMKFIVDEAAGLQDHLTLVVKIKAEWIFGDEGKAIQSASYQVWRRSGKPKGVFRFWYELGERFSGNMEEPMTACPRGMGVGSGSGDLPTSVAIGGDCPPQKLVDARSDRERLLSY
ncbi:hypothetical protein L1987_09537 [Smallanthus sonchifolius]|uniref:Uncharacterized protein n=1 Tax=Smallanthus sonchifolius TaxID=185202 RepID=A0ACB9JP20_9ASTR|nr:hypothetical protein L1987_09537 [Smallanthus sonchifolius]